MSTKHIRTIHDFSRHRRDIEVVCYCGHKAVLPFVPVVRRFASKGWPTGLGSAVRYFRCSKCGSRPAQIGPMDR